jgi:hypothetical protein
MKVGGDGSVHSAYGTLTGPVLTVLQQREPIVERDLEVVMLCRDAVKLDETLGLVR